MTELGEVNMLDINGRVLRVYLFPTISLYGPGVEEASFSLERAVF